MVLFEMACYISVGHPFIVELWLALRRLPGVIAQERQRRIQLNQERNAYRLSQRQNDRAAALLPNQTDNEKDPPVETNRSVAQFWARIVGLSRYQKTKIKKRVMDKIKRDV